MRSAPSCSWLPCPASSPWRSRRCGVPRPSPRSCSVSPFRDHRTRRRPAPLALDRARAVCGHRPGARHRLRHRRRARQRDHAGVPGRHRDRQHDDRAPPSLDAASSPNWGPPSPSTRPRWPLGLKRPAAIGLIIDRVLPEALIPNLDQTRTVGLVTLPGPHRRPAGRRLAAPGGRVPGARAARHHGRSGGDGITPGDPSAPAASCRPRSPRASTPELEFDEPPPRVSVGASEEGSGAASDALRQPVDPSPTAARRRRRRSGPSCPRHR